MGRPEVQNRARCAQPPRWIRTVRTRATGAQCGERNSLPCIRLSSPGKRGPRNNKTVHFRPHSEAQTDFMAPYPPPGSTFSMLTSQCLAIRPEISRNGAVASRQSLRPRRAKMDEIMCRSVITIISLRSTKGSAEAEGGGHVIDGPGSAFASVVLLVRLIVAHPGEMWVFS